MFYLLLDYFSHHPSQFGVAIALLLVAGALWLARERREMSAAEKSRREELRATRSIWKD